MVGTEVFRFGLAGSSVVEHPAHRDAINVGIGDAEADNAASEDVYDEQHPMAAQQDGFNPEQIGTPEAVLEVANECQPGRAIGPPVQVESVWQVCGARHLCRSRYPKA